MRFDQSETFTAGLLIPAAALNADPTPPAVDLGLAQAATIVLSIGVGGITFSTTNKVEFKLTHSDDDSDYAAVTADDVVGVADVGAGGIVRALTEAHAAGTVQLIGYVGRKRYLKLLPDFSGTHGAATPMSAMVLRGLPDRIAAPS